MKEWIRAIGLTNEKALTTVTHSNDMVLTLYGASRRIQQKGCAEEYLRPQIQLISTPDGTTSTESGTCKVITARYWCIGPWNNNSQTNQGPSGFDEHNQAVQLAVVDTKHLKNLFTIPLRSLRRPYRSKING